MWTLSSDVAVGARRRSRPSRARDAARCRTRWSASTGPRTAATSSWCSCEADRYWPDFCGLVGRAGSRGRPAVRRHAARRANSAACMAELDADFAAAPSRSGSSCWPASTRRGRRCSRSTELLDDPQVTANGYVADVEPTDGAAIGCRTCRCSSTRQPADLRRAPEHGEHTELILTRDRLRLGRDQRAADAGVIP